MSEATPAPELSVVVLGYRDERSIVVAVESVTAQAGEGIEVVVVTSGGDRSAALVRARFPGMTVVESARRLMPGAARNAGVAATRGRLIAFLAGDCCAGPGWVAGRLAAHGAGHRAVASAISLPAGAPAVARASRLLLYPSRVPSRPAGAVRHTDDGAHGLSIERGLLDALGPYDETARVAEDTDMARRLDAAGVTMWFAPEVRTVHAGPVGLRAFVADQYRRGRRRAVHAPPGGGAVRLIARGVADVRHFVAWSLGRALRHSPGQHAGVVALAPLVALGAAAGQAGWISGALRPERRDTR